MATSSVRPSQKAWLASTPFSSSGHGRLFSARHHSNCSFAMKTAFGGSIAIKLGRRKHSSAAFCSACLPVGATEADAEYMRVCVEIARKASGCTSPNPMVGCVIVKGDRIVGQGFHPKAGEPHAEVFALREAGTNAKGATAYVSLEPCNHYGRTPPCTNALIKALVTRVVVGMLDPNPIVSGKGMEALNRAGIEVVSGVETPLCEALNEAYIHRMIEKKPFVSLRFSMSLNGGIIESNADECNAGSYFSKLLHENDAVIVLGSTLSGNSLLHSSETGSKQPLRIVLSNDLKLPLESSVFDTTYAPTLVITTEEGLVHSGQVSSRTSGQSMESLLCERGVEVMVLQELSLASVLDTCYERGMCSVLLDSHGHVASCLYDFLGKQALEERVVQKVIADIYPNLGGHTVPGLVLDGFPLPVQRISSKMSGAHVIIEGYLPR